MFSNIADYFKHYFSYRNIVLYTIYSHLKCHVVDLILIMLVMIYIISNHNMTYILIYALTTTLPIAINIIFDITLHKKFRKIAEKDAVISNAISEHPEIVDTNDYYKWLSSETFKIYVSKYSKSIKRDNLISSLLVRLQLMIWIVVSYTN